MFGFGGSSQRATAWTKTLSLDDFTETADGKTTQAGQWLQYKYRVPAQQMIRFGTGAIRNGVDDRGIAVIDIKDNDSTTPVQIEGKYRLAYMDANEVKKSVIKEGYLNTIRASTTVRDAGNVLGETGAGARQDSWLIIEILPAEAGKTIEDDNSSFQIPVTVYTA